jgi:diguanylate cyclase (GGDEF)-like protein
MKKIGEYTIQSVLYGGGKFTIYRGVRQSDQTPVILKISRFEHPSANNLASLQHEYHILKQLNSPYIIRAYDIIQSQHQLALILEDVNSTSLHEYLKDHTLTLTDFFKIAIQLVDALSVLYLKKVIHKDINPCNILIDPNSLAIKVIDFSLSTQLNHEISDPLQIQNLAGTLAYISPEQTGRMNRSIDYRTDFYSLGITFYEMLTGTVPFTIEDPLELIHCHLVKTPVSVFEKKENIPKVLSAIISKLLAKMPEERYVSAVGLRIDLLRCQLEWNDNQKINIFPLGTGDIYDHLILSKKMYARETEVQELLAAFSRVSGGSRELLTLSGYPGIGKSSVVKEIYKPITEQKGSFTAGKYDRLNRNIPYSGLIEAFQELVRGLLSESDGTLLTVKNLLLKALGQNVGMMVKAIPDLALILGEQPSIVELLSVESQNRFSLTFQRFIRALARPEHPLVIFLDDVQWIDNASLELLKSLLLNIDSRYLLIILAYRNDKVSQEHVLMDMLNQLKINDVLITDLTLSPFKEIDVGHLLADTLSCSLEEVSPLAGLVLQKTHGNPFFMNEFLKNLYQDKLLYFSGEKRRWCWDLNEIKQRSITDNVVDLLILRIKKLPPESAELLELAACVGHLFDLKTLAVISEFSLEKTAQLIWEPLRTNLISPLGDDYQILEGIKTGALSSSADRKIEFKFSHDRIQQAAYSLIPEDMRSTIHLKSGRLLLKEYMVKEVSDRKDQVLFEILNHFNQCLSLISLVVERHELAKLNLLAGQKAKATAAYAAALNYLQSGIALLPDKDWQTGYDFLFPFYKEISECLFLLKKFNEAEKYIDELLNNARSTVDKAEVYFSKINAYVNTAKHQEAIALAKKSLMLFHQKLPVNPSRITILKKMLGIKWKSRKRKGKTFLIAATNPETLVINKILTVASSSAYQVNQNLFAYIACKVLSDSFSEGYTPETPAACLGYAMILISELNYIDEAFYFVELAKELQLEIKDNTKNARNFFIQGAFVNHWKYPLPISLELLEKSYQAGVEEGDLAYASFSRVMSVVAFYLGKPLAEIKESVDKSVNFLKSSGNKDFFQFFQFFRYAILLLREDDAAIQLKLNSIFEKMKRSKNKTALVFTYNIFSQVLFIKGDFSEAVKMSSEAYRLKKFVQGGFDSVYIEFFHALCLAACYEKVNKNLKISYLKDLKKIQKKFNLWSTCSPVNFMHAYLLISAEIKRITLGFDGETVRLYNEAILQAEEHHYLPFAAIASERASKLCFDSQNPLFAKAYLQNAHYAYLQWGALSKCRLLEIEHPDYIQAHSVSMPSKSMSISSTDILATNLDVLALFKATQAISGEIQLSKLLQKLTDILLKDAGASRAILLVREENAWFVEAEGTLLNQKVTLSQADPLENRSDIPLSLVSFAQRTQELVLIQQAKELERYSMHDPYLSHVKPQSILLLPVFYQGMLRHLLYLENRDTSYAFTPTHIQTLKLLASQAAISLENARLYHQATHDPLTGLANRNLLYQVFELSAARAKREKKAIAILFLDLDGFKKVNDTFGHELGDKVLLYFSEQIKLCLRESDLAVRLGGDEFIVMLEEASVSVASLIADRILKTFNKPITLMTHEIYVTVSIGISLYPEDGVEVQGLIKQADVALYSAKESGKANYQFYRPELHE